MKETKLMSTIEVHLFSEQKENGGIEQKVPGGVG